MLTCIACSKQLGGTIHPPQEEEADSGGTPSTKLAIKALKAQIKEMALKASGAYRHCKPCSGSNCRRHSGETGTPSERFHYSYRRTASDRSTPRMFGKELKDLSSGDRTPSMSCRTESETASAVVLLEEEAKEWVAQVEPGVLITFVSLPQGGNDLRRIRFSREMFNKWQAQGWWTENQDKVMELYNVQRCNSQAVPLPTPPRSEDENSKMESVNDSPITPPLNKECLPHNFHHATGVGYSSSDSLEHHPLHNHDRHFSDSAAPASTPKLSSISAAKTDVSSTDAASLRTNSSREADRSGELSAAISNASEQETEWVEQDEPGVYITIRALPGGIRELRRVRFSREKFGEMHARMWWDENRARIREQYL